LKKIFYFLLILLFISCHNNLPTESLSTLDKVSWLKNNATVINSVNPDEEDYSDLQPLKNAIGSSRIVMLGEESHGDGATFLMKTRLIKFLHDEMDFNILLFESGLFDCKKINDFLINGTQPLEAFRKGVFSIWTESEQFQPLIKYIGENYNTLKIGGFDCQFNGEASRLYLLSDLKDYLKKVNINYNLITNWYFFEAIAKNVINWVYYYNPPPETKDKNKFNNTLDEIIEKLENINDYDQNKEARFWVQVLKSTKEESMIQWGRYGYESSDEVPLEIQIKRDVQMGNNLIWQANTNYPNSKIIVWAATYHIARNIQNIEVTGEPNFYTGIITMGNVAWEQLNEQLYSIGFTAYEGTYGSFNFSNNEIKLEKPSNNSFEDLIYQTNYENVFINFRNLSNNADWLSEIRVSRPLGYSEMKANWTEILDGLLYIRTMFPSTRISN